MSKQESLFFVAFLFIFTSFAAAQTTSTEVLGTVSDATGAVAPGAEVTLLRVGTGERRRTVTDHSGNYSFPSSRSASTP